MSTAWDLLAAHSTGTDAWSMLQNIQSGQGGTYLADTTLSFQTEAVQAAFSMSPVTVVFSLDEADLSFSNTDPQVNFTTTVVSTGFQE